MKKSVYLCIGINNYYMKKRILYLITLFLTLIGIFIIQKPLFMWYNQTAPFSLTDIFDVVCHGLSLDASTAGYLTIIPLLVILGSVWFKKANLRKWMTPYLILVSILLSVIFVADMALYTFWGFKLDATVFNYLDSPSEALASVSTGYLSVHIIGILINAFLMAWLFLRITPTHLKSVRHRIWTSLIILLMSGGLFIIIRGGVTESTANIGQVYFSDRQFLNHSAVNPSFSLLSSASKTEKFEDMFDFFSESERAAIFNGLYPMNNDSTMVRLLSTTRPNILIILMEGFGSTMIESQGGALGASPNIDRLRKEGIFFSHLYANSYRTDRGTVSALSGYPGLPKTSVMKIPSKSRTLPAIAQSLKNAGYETDFLYGGDINFTNMKSYLLGTGFQKVTADTDFTMQERTSNAWGVNDDITFDYLYNVLAQRADTTRRWHTTFLTLSSHEPFEVPFDRFKDDKKLNSFAYTDDCLGRFIERIKALPLWKNLLVICLPDHGIAYKKSTEEQRFHIPMLWLGGAIATPMEICLIANQTDLAATLLGQLDLPYEEFTFSRNIFGKHYTYPFAFYTFNNGLAFRDSTGITVFDNDASMTTLDAPVPNEQRLKNGQAILQTVMDDLGKR